MQQEWTAGLSLTERCNEFCKHCYIGQKNLWKDVKYLPLELTREQVNRIIPQLVDARVTRVNLGGGETPLHPEFIDVVSDLRQAGIRVSLTTNGSTLPVFREHFGLFNDVGVSIDLPYEEHDAFRGNPKAFFWARRALDELVKANVRSEMVTCLMGINYDRLPELYAIAQDIGVDVWRLNRFHASRNDIVRFRLQQGIPGKVNLLNTQMACSPEQVRDAYRYLASISPNEIDYAIPDPLFRTLVNGPSVCPGTPYGKISFRIKTSGDITPDVFTDHSAGNLFQQPLRDILAGEVFQQFRERSPTGKCASCANLSYCEGGDLTDAYLMQGDLSAPDPYCFLDTASQAKTRLIPIGKTRHVHESYLATIYVPVRGMKP
jgi:radical SAM protein with 4Fe4S-binding SPASM domain